MKAAALLLPTFLLMLVEISSGQELKKEFLDPVPPG